MARSSRDDAPHPRGPAERAALRTRAAVAVAAGLLLIEVAGMIATVSARHVDGGTAALLTLPAAGAAIVALIGLAAEPDAWPPRRVLATVLAAGCLAAQLGLGALVSEGRGSSWFAVGCVSMLVNLVAVAVVDRRGRERGQLLLAVVLWTGLALVALGALLLAAYLRTHTIITIG